MTSGIAAARLPACRLVACALAAASLAACSPSRPAPPPVAAAPVAAQPQKESFVWARADGRRMATDPVLLRKGQEDKARCEALSSSTGQLDFNTFSICMNRAGYVRRDLPA